MTPSEFALLREDIGKLYEKADDCAKTGTRIETKLETHKEYIDGCYAFRKEQRILNNGFNEKLLKIKITKEIKAEYNGEDRRVSNLRYDRIFRILAIALPTIVGIFIVLDKFEIL